MEDTEEGEAKTRRGKFPPVSSSTSFSSSEERPGCVAQMEERLLSMRKVLGSMPSASSFFSFFFFSFVARSLPFFFFR